MSSHVVPPAAMSQLRHDLDTPSLGVYLVLASAEDDAWPAAKAAIGAMARSEAYLILDSADADEWRNDSGVSGWPLGSAWVGGEPTGICFGYGGHPRIYLTREEAEDVATVSLAHAKAMELTSA